MLQKFKTLNKKSKFFLILILVLLISFTLMLSYSFLAPFISEGTSIDLDLSGMGQSSIQFYNDDRINLVANTDTFGVGADNLVGTANVIVSARGNNSGVPYSPKYDIVINIYSNGIEYSSSYTPELILTIIDPNGNNITSLNGLKYVTENGVSGFDITALGGLINVANDYTITSDGFDDIVSHEWTFKVTLVAHEFSQNHNQDKIFNLAIESVIS